MANMLHGSARTTQRIRAELQRSKEKTSTLAQRYGLSRTTVTKWRTRTTTSDAPMGPSQPKSTVLSPAEEAVIVEFRRRTLLPLDDVMGCLRESIPKLSRSSLHRCLLRHGISRLPASEIKTVGRGKFAPTEMGYVHIDIAELRLAQGKLNMFLAIDRVSKFTYVEFRDDMGKGEWRRLFTWRHPSLPLPNSHRPHRQRPEPLQTCPRTETSPSMPFWACTFLAGFATKTGSFTSSPSPITRGRTGRLSG